MYPTELGNLRDRIEKRQRANYRVQLIITHNAQDQEATQKLLDQWADPDTSYLNKSYNASSVELFKQQVQRNRAASA